MNILPFFLFILSLNSSFCLFAQSTNPKSFGTWNILNLRYRFNEKWSIFAEGQIRSLRLYHHFHYHEFKLGSEYRLLPNLSIALAVGKYDNYQQGGNFIIPKDNAEYRIWPQLISHHQVGPLRIEHRYRVELRLNELGGHRFRL